MPTQPPVELVDVRRSFGDLQALAGVTFSAPAGQLTAVLGPNGAGKTTTLEICEGLQRADSGRVRVLGLDPVTQAAQLRPRVGVMIQDGGLPIAARPIELLTHVCRMYARPADPKELAGRLGLDRLSGTQVRHLSGGERQRLSLAIALAGRPELLFLDEPSAGLDPGARREVWQVIEEARATGTTIILTSHLMDEVEYLADQVVILAQGTVLTRGTVSELIHLRAEGTPRPSSVRVTGPISATDYAELSTWASARGLGVAERSLEDVFLDLTGTSLTDATGPLTPVKDLAQ